VATDQASRLDLYFSYIRAFDDRDLDRCSAITDELLDENYVSHTAGAPHPGGIQAWKEMTRQGIEENSFIQSTIEHAFGEGDRTVISARITATSIATGKTYSFPLVLIQRWDGNKIVEEWNLYGQAEDLP
jgi:hypothetical protein